MVARRPLRRLVVSTAALLGAALVLAGCSTQPGAAASVGGARIPEQAVLDRTSGFVSALGVDSGDQSNAAGIDLVNRKQATDLIRHQLVLVAAADQGIAIAPAQVNTLVSGQGGAAQAAQSWGVSPDAVPEVARDRLVLDAMLTKAGTAGAPVNDVQVTIDVLSADSRDDAIAARSKYLADPAAMATDIAAAGDSGGQAGAKLSFLASPNYAELGLFSAPVGSIIIGPLDTQTFLVARVTARAVTPSTLTSDTVSALQSAADQLSVESLLLAPYEKKDGVSLNPRFGDWDSDLLQAVPDNSGL